MAYTSSPFAGAQIDFSALAGIGQSVGAGINRRRLSNALEGVDAGDYNAMVNAIKGIDPIMALKMADTGLGAEERFGVQPIPIWNPETQQYDFYQSSNRGGPPQKMDFGGGVPTINQRWVETPEGYVAVPTRGPVGGGAAPRSVGTYDVKPDGSMSPTSAAVQSLKSQKQAHELASTHATDQALARNSVDKLEEQIANFSSLVDPSTGEPTEGLKAITGTTAVGIPKAWLPDVSQEARNATANLKTSAVQVGLNTLEQMRAMSAQGASGMGQLAIQESVWLQNSIRALQETQDPQQIAKHIMDIISNSRRAQERIRAKYKEIYGEELTQPEGYVSPVTTGNRTSTGIEWSIEP